MNRARLPVVWMGRICAATLLTAALFALCQVGRTTASYVLIAGLVALATLALPTMIVLWRWSRLRLQRKPGRIPLTTMRRRPYYEAGMTHEPT
jgi:hypothetical protein